MSEQTRRLLATVVTLALAGIVLAGILIGDESDSDRVQSIGSRLKCPVCQGEPIADSPSELARDMMAEVERQVAEGRSDQEIIDFFTARYTDAILLDPPFAGRTLLLWILPVIAFGAGIALIVGRTKRREPASGGESS